VIVNSLSEEQQFQVYRQKVFANLNEEPPQELPVVYTDMKSYQKSLASMVVEETIYTVLSSLGQIVQSVMKSDRKGGVYARITYRDWNNRKYNCFTYRPLQPYYRRELKAGTVVLILPKGDKPEVENFTFAILQRGSIKSSQRKY
jgi:hypothetical protein